MHALEDLYNEVRDPLTKPRVREAIDAYNAGAFRSAIISTWVAVSLDLVAKIRELADQGDGAALAWRGTLDAAITAGNKQKLQKIEADLLDDARTRFSFINEREYIELSRLRDDRHVCAHPAFVDVDKIFSPTAELVRVHLSTAVAAVLSQPPTPGRKALERFFAEIQASTWPGTRTELGAYLRDNYLDRGKQSLRENLAQVIIKGVLRFPEGSELVSERFAEAAHALDDVAPALLEQGLRRAVTNRFQSGGLPEDEALRLIGRLGDMAAVWNAIPDTAKAGLVAAIGRRDLDALISDGTLSTMQANADAAAAVEARLLHVAPDRATSVFTDIIGRRAAPHLWSHALREFAGSPGWRSAEERMRGLILPFAPHMTAEHIHEIAEATLANSQIREAASMPYLMEQLFTLVPLGPGVLAEWESFVSKLIAAAGGNPMAQYAYPGLQYRIAAVKSA
jgi:hypothetical protein